MPWTPWLDGIKRPFVARRVVFADRRARLHGVDDHALIGGLQSRHVFGFGEGVGDFGRVTKVVVERDIVRDGVEHQRRARFHRIRRLKHDWQCLDIDRHRFGSILCLRNGFRDDAGNRIAHEPDFIAC